MYWTILRHAHAAMNQQGVRGLEAVRQTRKIEFSVQFTSYHLLICKIHRIMDLRVQGKEKIGWILKIHGWGLWWIIRRAKNSNESGDFSCNSSMKTWRRIWSIWLTRSSEQKRRKSTDKGKRTNWKGEGGRVDKWLVEKTGNSDLQLQLYCSF